MSKQCKCKESKDQETSIVKNTFRALTALFTLIIAVAQATIALKQYEASKLSFSPIFIFQEELSKNDGSEKYDNESLKIVNMGFPINNYQSDIYVYVKATKTITTGKGSSKSIYIPVNYYMGSFSKSGGKDVLETSLGVDNNTDYVNLLWSVHSFGDKKEGYGPYYDIKLTKIIKITYSDIEGNQNTKYFIDQRPVNETDYELLKALGKETVATRDLRKMNPQMIVSLLEKNTM
ncbi:hypothetical protein [Pantoea ananatis]|uniref:hypothetical protein n=1 Tax=Pantoea ananas TaxID=553 RepID=UPI00059D67C5|nr:hypothetical protein [Pantoea ananatis]